MLPGLERSQNPAALLVLGNWAAQHTSTDSRERARWKLRLMRSAYEKGFRREEIVELYRFLDWLMELPAGLKHEFRENILRNEEQQKLKAIHHLALTSKDLEDFGRGLSR